MIFKLKYHYKPWMNTVLMLFWGTEIMGIEMMKSFLFYFNIRRTHCVIFITFSLAFSFLCSIIPMFAQGSSIKMTEGKVRDLMTSKNPCIGPLGKLLWVFNEGYARPQGGVNKHALNVWTLMVSHGWSMLCPHH